jgi:hypothetical protein
MADIDVAFVQKTLDIPERKPKPNIHNDGQADDFQARLEVTEPGTFCHPQELSDRPARLNKFSSASTVRIAS